MTGHRQPPFEIAYEWVHLQYAEESKYVETYGFSGSQGSVNLEGILMRPKRRPSSTLLVYMHPSSTLQLLPVPSAAASMGAHVLCAGSRYPKNDSALILEKVLLDLGAYIRHAKEIWKYEKVVLVGWSGGGSLATFYQSQAEDPKLIDTPAGDFVNIKGANLIRADAVIFQAAHLSRARLLLDWIDPSVRNEYDPDKRDLRFDIYDHRNLSQPPYTPGFIGEFREAQVHRIRRITTWVRETLERLRRQGCAEMERGFVVHRTMADPRFLDPLLEPNERRPRWCYLGNPETVNNGPAGLARFCTLRSWLSQWSIDDTRGDAVQSAARITVPFLAIEHGADDAVPQAHTRLVFEAASSQDKTFRLIDKATHYCVNQPDLLQESTTFILNWLAERDC